MLHAVFLHTRFLFDSSFSRCMCWSAAERFSCVNPCFFPRLCDFIVCVAGLLSRADLPCLQCACILFPSFMWIHSEASANSLNFTDHRAQLQTLPQLWWCIITCFYPSAASRVSCSSFSPRLYSRGHAVQNSQLDQNSANLSVVVGSRLLAGQTC